MVVLSAVMTDTDDVGCKDTNDVTSDDLWWEARESRIQMEEDTRDELREGKPIFEDADMTCGCVEINFWNCLESATVIGPEENTCLTLGGYAGGTSAARLQHSVLEIWMFLGATD